MNDLLSSPRRNRPISCINCVNWLYCGVIDNIIIHEIQLIQVSMNYFKMIKLLLIYLYTVTMDFSITDLNLTSFYEKMISNYPLLLPEIEENSSCYYVIDSDWRELNDEMEFVKPLSPYYNH